MGSKKRKPLTRQLINTLIVIIILSVGYVCFILIYDLRIRYINRCELQEIAALNKDYSVRFGHFIDDIEKNTEWRVEIISGLRSKEEQLQLKKDNPRNATVNRSRHVLGRAVDLNLYRRNGFLFEHLKKGNSKASWRATGVPELAKRHGLLWGGNYRNYHDPVHFEIN